MDMWIKINENAIINSNNLERIYIYTSKNIQSEEKYIIIFRTITQSEIKYKIFDDLTKAQKTLKTLLSQLNTK